MTDLSDALQRLTLTQVTALKAEELGRGTYGKVFKVRYKGIVYAAKEIHALLIECAGLDENIDIRLTVSRISMMKSRR